MAFLDTSGANAGLDVITSTRATVLAEAERYVRSNVSTLVVTAPALPRWSDGPLGLKHRPQLARKLFGPEVRKRRVLDLPEVGLCACDLGFPFAARHGSGAARLDRLHVAIANCGRGA